MNTQAITVERFSGQHAHARFPGSWSTGALVGAVTGAVDGGAGPFPEWATARALAVPCLLVVGWLTTRMIPDQRAGRPTPNPSRGKAKPAQWRVAGVRSWCWGASPSPTCCARVPPQTGPPSISATRCTSAAFVAGLAYAAYALAMLSVRLSGNRIFTTFAAHRVLPLLAAVASLGFAAGLVIARPASVVVGFALLGAGLGRNVVPMILHTAGAVDSVDTGKAVAAVAGCGWAGYVVGPVVIGGIAATTTLHVALFLIPILAVTVAVATGSAKALRHRTRPASHAAPSERSPAAVDFRTR